MIPEGDAKMSNSDGEEKQAVRSDYARWLTVQRIVVADNFLRMVHFTSNMTEAYSLAKEVGEGAVWSGLIISSAWGLSAVGALIGWRVARMGHSIVRKTVRATPWIIVLITFVYMLGANPPQDWFSTICRKKLLLGSRFAYGLVASIQSILLSIDGARVTPAREMVDLEMYKQCARTLGIGGGPLLSAFCSYFLLQVNKDSAGLRSSMPAFLLMWLWVFFSVRVVRHFPEDKTTMDLMHQAKLEADQVSDGAGDRGIQEESAPLSIHHAPLRIIDARRCVVVMGMLYGIERSFIVSALESATAFILETEFHYSSVGAGLAVGCTFIVALPAMGATRLSHSWSSGSSNTGLLKIVTHCCCFASLLLFADSSPIILASCTIIFSMSYLASSITDGLALAYTVPGTTLCIENYVLVDQIGQNTVARLLGPVAARLAIRHGGGRATYAYFQIAVSLFGVLVCKMLTYCESICERHSTMTKKLRSDGMSNTYNTVSVPC